MRFDSKAEGYTKDEPDLELESKVVEFTVVVSIVLQQQPNGSNCLIIAQEYYIERLSIFFQLFMKLINVFGKSGKPHMRSLMYLSSLFSQLLAINIIG